MKKILGLLGFLCLVLSGSGASAAVTSIAQLPLLNINGTGNVRPNLMLLYDNSGSMAYTFTPDFVDDTTTCRLYSKMWTVNNRNTVVPTTQGCTVGHPPFNSSDFNRQYYDPKVRYTPPVDATGKSYNAMTRAETSNWTSVKTDGFGVNKRDLLNGAYDSTNLVTGFPDLKWCDTNKANCVYNTATYTYPNDNRYTGVVYYGNPYYYTINVAEWCIDTTMTVCKTTNVGDDAPAGYPVPAKVRWCSDASLSLCRAKYSSDDKDSKGNTVPGYKYPRFANPTAVPVAAYGTITIGATSADTNLQINAITVAEPTGVVTISNGSIPANGGTNSAGEQTAMATAIAASITAKTGLTNQYVACVKTPSNSNAKACSEYGITLATNNIVAVIPIDCRTGATTKDIGTCSVVSNDSRSGWTIGVDTDAVIIKPAQRPTAIVTVTGSGGSNTTLSGTTSLADTTLLSYTGNNSLSLKNTDANGVVSKLVTAIGTGGAIKAYIGGDATTDVCKGYAKNVLCLVDTSTISGGKALTMGTINSNPNNLKFTTLPSSTPQASAIDKIPVSTTPLGAGAAIFVRTDIIPSVNSYPKDLGRTDCMASTCSYDEEMTNFANWYAYYKSRNQMMKTAVGQAFQSLTANYNVGIVSLSVAAAQGNMNVPKQFSGADRAAWYTSLYAMNGNQSTPIRQALHSVGLMYANKENYELPNSAAAVQYACQQNFTFITTDGYWNGNPAKDVVNNDNVASRERFCALDTGCLDTRTQDFNSLADVALYWYNGGSNGKGESLRRDLENMDKDGLVPAGANDNQRLHMNTYALGLGVDGVMNYEAKYDTFPVAGGDFYNLTNGVAKNCPWNGGGPYVWPDPKVNDNSGSAAYQSRVDDLWHAAINGHGKYFSASDPTQVVQGLSTALSNIQVRVGAAAAAATSTPNISQEDNDVFSSTFTTVKWFGQLSDRKIDTASGVVGDTALWTTSDTVGLKVGDTTDTRDIRMLSVETNTLKPFKYASMTATERAWFDNKCNVLSQCAGLSAANQAIVNDGGTIIDWLRGQQAYANDNVLRSYTRTEKTPAGATGPIPIVLGDIASSKPAYLREPRKGYTSTEYTSFKNDAKVVARKPAVFVAANDGMLHAFDAKTGTELWAYVPRITMRKLPAQASVNYGLNHQFTTDGAPEIGDVKIGTAFHSVLVAGLNGGGRGFYALDVTDPANPAPLWELCADAALCAKSDADLGLSFGNPQFGTWKDANGVERWVVFLTSGYNNVPGTDGVAGGDGKGYLYVVDAATGQVLNKTSTGAGSVATPSGFARITAITANPLTDPLVTYLYGGDNSGKMWRFDFTRPGAPTVLQMGDAGTAQPVTTRPEVTMCQVDSTGTDGVVTSGVSNMVVFGTGRLLDVGDIGDTGSQSVYVLKDKGTGIAAADWRKDAAMSHQVLTRTKAGNYTIGGPAVTPGTQAGWYFDIDQNKGERVNLDPKVVSGTLNVVSNIPTNSTSCTVGGTSNLYQLDVCTGKPLLKDDTDGMIAGRALSTTSAAVGFIIVRLPSGDLKLVATTADGGNLTKELPSAQAQDARKAGWRRVRD